MRDWLKKLQLKRFVAGAIVMAILLSAGTALANTVNRSIDVIFRDIRMVVNGQPFTPRDAQGNVIEPFIFEGTTFLPVRAVSDALDIPVGWDGITSTVYLGNIPGGTPFSNITPFENQNILNDANATMLGVTYSNVIVNTSHRILTGVARYALNGNYTTFTGNVGRADNQRGTQTISFIGDGRELLTVTVDENTTQFTPISVDLRGVLILEIRITLSHIGAGVLTRPLFVANAMIE